MSKAVVVGGTGAVGQHVVGQLLQSGAWEKVVTVGYAHAMPVQDQSMPSTCPGHDAFQDMDWMCMDWMCMD
eukprot:CAMPEP_0119103278 /NCGR_PEP_ID=MMETSP1180-20130426/1747_1 /TAXON_ID=3052 ORGANISM="Chlamydomonas cf sp, Strain CCMP681" /NCGR_SAMPLE_ID=MMETSP1180 /ASSEMBLY_ACC=CAM_ASM_000741 /LENGTH=70 /DNA_ID=CAMNT_0007087733 /DNA_START=102 /DNA_END=312 /DNA_ORIENTATION=+